jgi:hypothetical protein
MAVNREVSVMFVTESNIDNIMDALRSLPLSEIHIELVNKTPAHEM